MGYGMNGQEIKIRFLERARDFSLLHSVQTSSGAHPVSCPEGPTIPLPRGRMAGKVKLVIHLHIVQTLRIFASIPPFPHVSSWHGT
jgi:hypothetical protein